ncbi:hypothetical protein GCM10023231_13150 [Olivibacter ginsenosidimutans]|uniref:Thioredoxin domain-containing protein n=1 Tax=Olivibacter ginsenosidimutans TaxID=1176537 RepID=A0ABP9AYT0_9SPHI
MSVRIKNLWLVLFILSCQEPNKPTAEKSVSKSAEKEIRQESTENLGSPIIPKESIVNDFKSFWNYYSRYVELYNDFYGLDEKGQKISRIMFLKEMSKGKYYPLLVHGAETGKHYQLTPIPAQADADISVYMKDFAQTQLVFCEMEGKALPTFTFVDLRGNTYTSANTKGKLLVLKCWFINCVPCVEEMPDLNKLVEKYKSRDDIVFIGLALDDKQALEQFLKQKTFDYHIIPHQKEYITGKLHVNAYPTHFLINKKGELVHNFPDAKHVEEAIQQELKIL